MLFVIIFTVLRNDFHRGIPYKTRDLLFLCSLRDYISFRLMANAKSPMYGQTLALIDRMFVVCVAGCLHNIEPFRFTEYGCKFPQITNSYLLSVLLVDF